MSVETPPTRPDRRSLRHLDAAVLTLDRMLATPRDAALRGPVVLDAISIARGLRPSVQNRQYADTWLRELLAEHRALLAAAVEQDHAAVRATAREERRDA
ncbi:hypothetical protein [Microbacterium maritypicum]|uniref:hypothetical protein n=1 Tax=Microbacterium maritypicum TaxID=33918 RepID=UPI001478BBDD|nr:hypothetical protein [Microbacterium liquefaciens]